MEFYSDGNFRDETAVFLTHDAETVTIKIVIDKSGSRFNEYRTEGEAVLTATTIGESFLEGKNSL